MHQLKPLLTLYFTPIKQLVSLRSIESTHLGVRLELICFQLLATPNIATLRLLLEKQQVHHWLVHPGPLVLWICPLNTLTLSPDMDQTVSRMLVPYFRKGMDYASTRLFNNIGVGVLYNPTRGKYLN